MRRALLAALVVLLLFPVGASGQQDVNLKAIGGAPVVTGTGGSGYGIPRVTIANDSRVGQGDSGWLRSPWFQALTDSVNGPVAVKPPFLAPTAADPSLVVALSPNSRVPFSLFPEQGSPTGGQTGPLAQGAVTTAAPTYTTGQTSPFSLTTTGALRVDTGAAAASSVTIKDGVAATLATVTAGNAVKVDGSAVTQPISGALTANQSVNMNQIGGTAVSGADVVDAANTAFRVNCVTGCVAGGSFTDNSAFTAGSTSESNVGGVFNDSLAPVTSGNAGAARITAQRGVHVNLRNRIGEEIGTATRPLTVLGTVTADVGAAVKRPFGQATASDPSLVVALSPGTPLPSGTNVIGAVTGSGTFQVSGSVALTGPVTANIGTVGSLALDSSVNGLLQAQGSRTANQQGPLVQGAVTAFPPFTNARGITGYATGQTAPLSLTEAGALRVDGSAVTQPVSGSVSVSGVGSGQPTLITACDTWTSVSLTTNTQIITGVARKQIYVCSINLVVAAATNVALVSGTGSTCATGIAGMAGGTTAATGWNLAANGGLAHGTGVGVIARSGAAGDNVCILVSAANQTSGVISWAQY